MNLPKLPRPLMFCLLLACLMAPPLARGQGTAFTYQGFLLRNGGPASGLSDFEFRLFDAATGGNQQGGLVSLDDVGVTNGLFTVTLDFGAGLLDGSARWLDIAVRPGASAGDFTNLAPRQPITSTPYAVRAANAGTATTASSVAAANITGTIPLARLPASVVTNGASGVTFSGTFSGNGAALTNVTARELATQGVLAWGDNSFGQTTVPASAQSGVVAIAAGDSHTVALKNDGRLLAWGRNDFGQTTVPAGASSGVMAIAAGGSHTVALKNDGSVLAWGNNAVGQTNVPPEAQSGVVAIAAGFYHTLALKNDGSVLAWGYNNQGQSTVPAGASNGVVAIAAGFAHSVALKNDGSVVAWGENFSGQATVPVEAQSGVVAIEAGSYHTVALKSDGRVLAWGGNTYGETNVPSGALSGVKAVAAGGWHTVALKNDGSVLAWGANSSGQSTVPPGASSGVAAIAAGGSHTLVLVGQVAWARNTFQTNQAVAGNASLEFGAGVAGKESNAGKIGYQLFSDGLDILGAGTNWFSRKISFFAEGGATFNGPVSAPSFSGDGSGLTGLNATNLTGTIPLAQLPASVVTNGASGLNLSGTFVGSGAGLTGLNASQLTTGTIPVDRLPARVTAPATPAQLVPKFVAAWGNNSYNQSTVPTNALSGVVAVAAGGSPAFGGSHTLVLKFDGSALAWGANSHGQGSVPEEAQAGMVAIAAGNNYNLALKDNGRVIAWGVNTFGVTNVPGTAQSGVVAIAAGYSHVVALKNDGGVVAWGGNTWGQSSIPAIAQSDVVAVAAGGLASFGGHTVVLKSDGSTVAWGDNSAGQTNVPMAAQSGVVAIAAGYMHTVALKNDGSVLAWGENGDGQTNVPPGAQSNVVAIAAGGHRTMALKGDGSIVAWGENWSGQSSVPAEIQTNHVVAIAAGASHSVAIVGYPIQWSVPIVAPNFVGQFSGSGAGLTNLSIESSEITDGTIVDEDISGSAAIADTKLATISTPGKVSDSALSTNVALRSGGNTFSGNQTVTDTLSVNGTLKTSGDFRVSGFGATGLAFIQARDDSGTNSLDLVIRSQLNGAVNDAMRVRFNGNVGIGTPSPQSLLQIGDVEGAKDAMIRLATGNSSIQRMWMLGVPYGGNDTTGTNYDFIIADSTATVRFMIDHATGNVGIGNDSPTNRLMVVNARCDGSSWINASDRNLKQNFAAVDPLEVLAKVTSLPIQSWSYKEQPEQKHVGPVAQDFRAAFGLGQDETSIATVDADGVALAAIQGLNEKLESGKQKAETRMEKLEAELQRRDAENAELKQELTKIKRLLEKLSATGN